MSTEGLDVTLGPGREFDIIRRFAAEWGANAAALGDDAAIIPLSPGMNLVASTDAMVEWVHFARAWLTPYEIGWRATAAALSDLAAMAAQPLGVLTALTLPESWLDDAIEIASGIGDAAAYAGTRIVGGDLSRGAELALCVTVLGSVARPLTRAAAVPGQTVYVTGRLGGAGAAVTAWERGRVPLPEHRERFAKPHPRIREAGWLAAEGASAAIDISDGLLSDLAHVAAASGVVIEVELDRVPSAREVAPEQAAASGEEYEIAVVMTGSVDAAAFHARFGLDVTACGSVTGVATGGELVVLQSGKRVDPPRGYDHFSL
jgi:thiamine-monophosphate kinase